MAKSGRPPKSGGEYANSRAVEEAMLRLLRGGKEWGTSGEVVSELRRANVPNARVVWNRGKDRMIQDHRRLEVKAELDSKQRVRALYRLRFVEGKSYSIPIEAFKQLPEELKRFYRPYEPATVSLGPGEVVSALGTLLDGLSKANLQSLKTEDLEAELMRRERKDPNELLIRRPDGKSIYSHSREAELMADWYRPVSDRVLRELVSGRRRPRTAPAPRRASRSGMRRNASRRPA